MGNTIEIRPERRQDIEAVHAINLAAFQAPGEAKAVDTLRAAGLATLSLVAEQAGKPVGHILFSPVTLNGAPTALLGLAPMAVHPDHQNRGIGSLLVPAGLAACRELGVPAVVVLGHPAYYPRFGFKPAPPLGLQFAGLPDCEAFFVIELTPGTLDDLRGEIRFDPTFDGL